MTREQFRNQLMDLINNARDAGVGSGYIATELEAQLDLINEESNDNDD